MIVQFSEAVSPSAVPPSVGFPGLDRFTFTGSMVVGWKGETSWTLAIATDWKNGMVVYRVDPVVYAAFHNCPVCERRWSYYNVGARD